MGEVRVKLKPVMTTSHFALVMTHVQGEPWSTQRARRWLARRGLLEDYGKGRWCVTMERLREVLPQLTGNMRVMLGEEMG